MDSFTEILAARKCYLLKVYVGGLMLTLNCVYYLLFYIGQVFLSLNNKLLLVTIAYLSYV